MLSQAMPHDVSSVRVAALIRADYFSKVVHAGSNGVQEKETKLATKFHMRLEPRDFFRNTYWYYFNIYFFFCLQSQRQRGRSPRRISGAVDTGQKLEAGLRGSRWVFHPL